MSVVDAKRESIDRELIRKAERRWKAFKKKWGHEPEDAAERRARYLKSATDFERSAKRLRHASTLYLRLSRGQHPFRREPQITTEDMRRFDAELVRALVEAGA